MKIKNQSLVKQKLAALHDKLYSTYENENNSDHKRNGEESFIKQLCSYYKNQHIMVFDVGANIGSYSDLIVEESIIHSCAYVIHLFEPLKECFKLLKKKYHKNKKLHFNNLAASDRNGKTWIYYDNRTSSLASLYKRKIEIKFNKRELVYLRRLDTYIKSGKIQKINLLKLDVEGHELVVLRGLGKYLNNNFIDFIQFEYGGCNLDSKTTLRDLYVILEQNGFKIGKIMTNHIEIRQYNTRMESYQYSNFLAISNKIVLTN